MQNSEGIVISTAVFLSLSLNHIVDFLVHYDVYGFLFGIYTPPVNYPYNILACLILNAIFSMMGLIGFTIAYKKVKDNEKLVTFIPSVVCVAVPFLLSSIFIHYWAIPPNAYTCLVVLFGSFFLMFLKHPKNRNKMKTFHFSCKIVQWFLILVVVSTILACISFPLIENLMIRHTSIPAQSTLYFNSIVANKRINLKYHLGSHWAVIKYELLNLLRLGLIYQYIIAFIIYFTYSSFILLKLYNCLAIPNVFNLIAEEKGKEVEIKIFNPIKRKILNHKIKLSEFNGKMRDWVSYIFPSSIVEQMNDGDLVRMKLVGRAKNILLELYAAYHPKMRNIAFGRCEVVSRGRFEKIRSMLGISTNTYPLIKIKIPVRILLIIDAQAQQGDSFWYEIDDLKKYLFPYITRGYFELMVLAGSNVTYENIKRGLQWCHIAHFSTHVFNNGEMQYVSTSHPHFVFSDSDVLNDVEVTPPIVFMNGCESGKHGGFAEAFIKKGTKIFIGSVHPVPSDVAATCALWFYQHLLFDEMPAGIALIEMRKNAERFYREKYGKDLYLPYILYGNPATRIILYR